MTQTLKKFQITIGSHVETQEAVSKAQVVRRLRAAGMIGASTRYQITHLEACMPEDVQAAWDALMRVPSYVSRYAEGCETWGDEHEPHQW